MILARDNDRDLAVAHLDDAAHRVVVLGQVDHLEMESARRKSTSGRRALHAGRFGIDGDGRCSVPFAVLSGRGHGQAAGPPACRIARPKALRLRSSRRALAGLLARGLAPGWPSRVSPVASSAMLAAYSCGGSAGLAPASLLAREVTRGNQSPCILWSISVTCQYMDFAKIAPPDAGRGACLKDRWRFRPTAGRSRPGYSPRRSRRRKCRRCGPCEPRPAACGPCRYRTGRRCSPRGC